MDNQEILLTSQDLEQLLQVNRVTIYRMIKDGRLKGVKIGKEWRFREKDIANLLGRKIHQTEKGEQPSTDPSIRKSFPTHCIQTIQNVCSDLGEVSTIIIDLDGTPLTQFSNPNQVCVLLHTTENGKSVCRRFMHEIGHNPAKWGRWSRCPAGISLFSLPVTENEIPISVLMAGFYYLDNTDLEIILKNLEENLAIDPDFMQNARNVYRTTFICDSEKSLETTPYYSAKVVEAVEGILAERSGLMQRLQDIAEISSFASEIT